MIRPAFWAVLTAAAIALTLAVCFLTDSPENFAENAEPDPAPFPQANIIPPTDVNEQETGLEKRRADMFASEESFSSALLNSYTKEGYAALSYEDFTAQYTVKLLSLPNLPEGYKSSGCVLVRPDRGMPDHIMTVQLWYNYDLQTEIVLFQNDFHSAEPISFFYTSQDEMGTELKYTNWMSYRAIHIGSLNGKYYDLLLFTTQDRERTTAGISWQSQTHKVTEYIFLQASSVPDAPVSLTKKNQKTGAHPQKRIGSCFSGLLTSLYER